MPEHEPQPEQEKIKNEKGIISSLDHELKHLEKEKGKDDPQYEILAQFLQQAQEEGFRNAYSKLSKVGKYVVIDALESREVIERDYREKEKGLDVAEDYEELDLEMTISNAFSIASFIALFAFSASL